jgi:amino acid permease
MRVATVFVCLLGCITTTVTEGFVSSAKGSIVKNLLLPSVLVAPTLALAFKKTSSNQKNQQGPLMSTASSSITKKNDKKPRFHRRALATERRGSTATGAVAMGSELPEEILSDASIEKSKTSSGIAAATFGLVKAMVGSGVLTLPAGLAAVSNYPSALGPASLLLIVLGGLSGYTFALYGRLSDQTQAKSLGELWKKVMKTDQSLLISACTFIYCFGCLLSFGLVIGDSMSSLAVAGGLTGFMATRHASILAVTAGLLYPLCNLSSLAALAPVSVVGVLGSLVTTLFMGLRCPTFVASSPYATAASAAAGPMLRSIPAAMQPSFSTFQKGIQSPTPLILIAMASSSLMAHFSAPDFYHSLKDPADSSNKNISAADSATKKPSAAIQKFIKMTISAFVGVTLINGLTLAFGFLTFGGNSAGIILNNYSSMDIGASISRLLVAVSVIGGYPFIMSACRSEGLELFANGKEKTRGLKQKATAILLTILTSLCLVLKDAGFVISFNGALLGSALMYTFPAMLFLKQTSVTGAGGEASISRSMRLERMFCRFLILFGVLTGLVGAATSVLNSYFPHLLV